ncbi:hypothetical protein JCGZ_07461 [Jatropha curcas]|uniref:RING-type E3 ubiquitin transferase n=1 Tax=Jatropha curcas TaxID=180498 RepID=A0A067KNM2_JATCU|nr:RING-H2 finger protein ATL52 [Jatropha curcas]KDP33890.1 hypothetical protein JCGZ_07461 [Jatropha curcas]
MNDASSPYNEPPPPSPPSQKSNLPTLYYGLVIVGTAAIVLAVYNLIIIKWCTHRNRVQGERSGQLIQTTRAGSGRLSSELSSFKYKKDNNIGQGCDYDYECSVCLSVFEEGEEVRRLPDCSHSFHAPCIDMWLYSHSDCPLCRARVDPIPSFGHRRPVVTEATEENSRENLLDATARIHFIPLV